MQHDMLSRRCGVDRVAYVQLLRAAIFSRAPIRVISRPRSGSMVRPRSAAGAWTKKATERDVDRDGPECRHGQRQVKPDHEGRDVNTVTLTDLAARDRRLGLDRAHGGIDGTRVTGSTIGTRPDSRTAVTVQIVLLPDIGVNPPCSSTTMPKSEPGSTGGSRKQRTTPEALAARAASRRTRRGRHGSRPTARPWSPPTSPAAEVITPARFALGVDLDASSAIGCTCRDDWHGRGLQDGGEPLPLIGGQGLDGQPRRTGGVAGQVQAGLDAGDVVDGLEEVADRPQVLHSSRPRARSPFSARASHSLTASSGTMPAAPHTEASAR